MGLIPMDPPQIDHHASYMLLTSYHSPLHTLLVRRVVVRDTDEEPFPSIEKVLAQGSSGK